LVTLPMLLARFLGRRTLIKLHYMQYGSTYFIYRPMSFVRRFALEHYTAFRDSRPLSVNSLRYQLESMLRLYLRVFISLAGDRVVACSDFLAGAATLPRPVQTLYNSIEIQPGRTMRSASSLASPFCFTFIGRLAHEKGCDLLIAASALLRDAGCAFQVQIIGDGPDQEFLQRRTRDLGLADRVHFIGKIAHADIFSYIEAALAVVVPSRWQEPAGYIPIEAASRCTAVIAARCGGLPEVAGPHNAYFTRNSPADLADKMRAFLDDPADCLRRGYDSYVWASRKFSVDRIASDFLRLCR
jgi:glycosyltransferase involved in cell wall biosynthesis